MNNLRKSLIFVLLCPLCATAHGGGKDAQGGHIDRQAGKYHFHDGPLVGQTYASKEAARSALRAVGEGFVADNRPCAVGSQSGELSRYLPSLNSNSQVVVRAGYVLSYSEEHEQAEWVAYIMSAACLKARVQRSNDFRIDPVISTGSASVQDYRGSGYDRGHLAPAASMAWSAEVMSESFYLSNMSPQVPGFNRGIWRKLEQAVRDLAYDDRVLVLVTGPILEDGLPVIGVTGVSVPKRFYKVLLDITDQNLEGIGFILPNEPSSLPVSNFAVPIDHVEQAPGIDFFEGIEDEMEERIERAVVIKHWNSIGQIPVRQKIYGTD